MQRKLSSKDTSSTESTRADLASKWQGVVRRRAFLPGMGIAGAAATSAATAGGLLAQDSSSKLHPGDVAILRFLAAAELIESDLWEQYNEIGGATGGNAAYKLALQNLDSDMPQYISDNTDDEMSHGRLSQRVPDFQRREARGPGRVSHSAEQPGDRGAGTGTADQPDESQRGHQLVHPLSQHAESGSRGHLPASRQHRERTGHSPQ